MNVANLNHTFSKNQYSFSFKILWVYRHTFIALYVRLHNDGCCLIINKLTMVCSIPDKESGIIGTDIPVLWYNN